MKEVIEGVANHCDLLWCDECIAIYKKGKDVDTVACTHSLMNTGFVEWN